MPRDAAATLGVLFRIVAAHLICDFVLQPGSWVRDRSEHRWRSRYLYLHSAVAAGLAYGLAGVWDAVWFPFAVFVSHVVIDGIKSSAEDTSRAFLADQASHLFVALLCWLALSSLGIRSLTEYAAQVLADPRVWFAAVCYIAVLWPAGALIGKLTAPLRFQMCEGADPDRHLAGLDNAGLWIGRLERVLILTFVLIGRFEAIGFLIAAKSVFRFADATTSSRRKETEYVLIGTLISFTVSVVAGILARFVIDAVAVGSVAVGQ